MHPISVPAWASHTCEIEPTFGAAEYRKVSAQRDLLLSAVHAAVQQYIDRRSAIAPESGRFPSLSRLSGEYYIGDESYFTTTGAGGAIQYRISIMARCLEHPAAAEPGERDYLGLEVHFKWLPSEARFVFEGDVDSSAI